MPATDDLRIDWNSDGDWNDTGEDVTSRALARSPITIQYGRDTARALSPIAPGTMSFELNNISRDYSPENASSPLNGLLGPGRAVRYQRTLSPTTYTMFRGHLDDYDLLPERSERSVRFTCLDALAKFSGVTISTDLYFSIRTGQAIGYILDEIGWPTADRDLDAGATLIPWWWEEQTDAFQALERIVNSEGPPAFVFVDADGKVVFRDRHHRLIRAASTTSQATFRDTGTEPKFSAPLVYDAGWRDIINSVTLSVEERAPAGTLQEVWLSEDSFSISDGETKVIRAEGTDPFVGAVVPSSTPIPSEDPEEPDESPKADYVVVSGAVTVTLSRTSGASATIFVKATGGPAVVRGMRLRAYPVAVQRTVQVHDEDSTSISKHGRRSYSQDAPWAGQYDAQAIADTILAQRAERLPVVSFTIKNANDTRLTQQLARDLSDRITIVDAQTGLSSDFYIEQIQHTVSGAGKFHETTFGCEKAPTIPANVFRFDTVGAGFNDGVFAATGTNDPATLFLFDGGVGRRFDEGVFSA